jgi:hypothetical protein
MKPLSDARVAAIISWLQGMPWWGQVWAVLHGRAVGLCPVCRGIRAVYHG